MVEDKTAADDQSVDVDLDAPLVTQGGYIENPDHKPDPYHQYGTVETTDFGATPSEQMMAASPVFAEARAQNLRTAARALDPNDPTPAELVVLPAPQVTVQGSDRTSQEGRDDVLTSVQRLIDEPVVVGITPGAQAAAVGTLPEDADDTISDDERERTEAKTEAQEAEARRLADQRAGDTTSSEAPKSTTGTGSSTASATRKPATTTTKSSK